MAQSSPQLLAQMQQVLIVAPTDALRNSLRFLLEEESYAVTTAASIREAAELPARYACTVLDHHAISADTPAHVAGFVAQHRPVVVLVNDSEATITVPSFRHLTKPLLGAALSQAVHDAIGQQPG